MNDEISSFKRTETYELVDRPKDKNVVGNKWVYKLKVGADGSPKHKARLVAQGFTQKRGIDYDETYSPVVKLASIRMIIAMANALDYELHHMDVNTAFLNAKLEEEIYMAQAPGYEQGKNKVWKLNRAVYGLKQSPREWYKCMDSFLTAQGFRKLNKVPTRMKPSVIT